MDTNTMKRMIILKDLNSNLVEEAYVIFKNNVKIHKFQEIDHKKNVKENEIKKDEENKELIIKEAEFIVDDYISKLESRYYKKSNICLKQNDRRQKLLLVSFAMFSILDFILLLIK